MASYEKSDFWALKAKKEGYPARSVYKLQEIDKKFGLIKPGYRILDIGSAPGSWSLWILKRLAGTGYLAAVDLQDMQIASGADNFLFIRGNLYDEEVSARLAALGPYNLVLSDAAPSTSGNRFVDQSQSASIVEAVMEYGSSMLKEGGSLVAKIFQGGGERELLDRLHAEFAAAKTYKPEACRSQSFETYLVATGFRKTAPIRPRSGE